MTISQFKTKPGVKFQRSPICTGITHDMIGTKLPYLLHPQPILFGFRLVFLAPIKTSNCTLTISKLFSKTKNKNPIIKPESEISSGSVRSPIQFYSNAKDNDGAISYYLWDFGDGSSSTHPNPEHTYLQRGKYKVGLTAIDNEGGTTHQELEITIADNFSPTIILNTPVDTLQTTSPIFQITGKATASTGRMISGLVWDNISSDQAKQINIAPDTTAASFTEIIKLKPGKNTILLTATDSFGSVSTKHVEVYREITQPKVSNITVNVTELSVYEKLEIQFDLQTTASTPFFFL